MFGNWSPRLVLIVFGVVTVSACGAGLGSSVPVASTGSQPASSNAGVAAIAASPALAHDPTAASAHPTTKGSTARAGVVPVTSGAAATKSGLPSSPVSSGASAPVPAAATSGSVVYGISDPELFGESASAQIQTLEQMKSLGVTSVRLDASWYWGQPTQGGPFVWGTLDQAVSALRTVGLSVDLDINQTPTWAGVSGANGSSWAQPASPAAFAAWAGAVAARYGPQGVQYYEIWNEENTQGSWEPTPNPAAYTADLEAAYAAIKAADPSAVVLSGGLSPAADTSTSYDPRTFLADMYADGAGGSFDGVGDHPYTYPATPDQSVGAWSLMNETSPSLRGIMVQNGDSAKKIWITEYGAPTTGPNSVSESDQSTEIVQAISQVKQLSWVGSFYIYTWSDVAGSPTVDNGFGLLDENNAQKPVYAAVASALAS